MYAFIQPVQLDCITSQDKSQSTLNLQELYQLEILFQWTLVNLTKSYKENLLLNVPEKSNFRQVSVSLPLIQHKVPSLVRLPSNDYKISSF